MCFYKLPLEVLLLVADYLGQRDLLSWIQTDDLTYAVLSERVFNRIVALDEKYGWPVSLFHTAAADQMVMFRAILKRTKDSELNKDKIRAKSVPVKDWWKLVQYPRYHSPRTSVLHILCYLGNEHVIRMILDTKSIKLSPRDSAGWTPIHVAASKGHNSIIGRLLLYGVDVNEAVCSTIDPRLPQTDTALHLAIGNGHLSTVKYLVEEGADVQRVRGVSGQDSLWLAAREANLATVKYLLAQGCFDTKSITGALLEAVGNGEADYVDRPPVAEGSHTVAMIELLLDAGAKYTIRPDRKTKILNGLRSAAAAEVLFRKFPSLAAECRSLTPSPLDCIYHRLLDKGPTNWNPCPLALTLIEKGIKFSDTELREEAFLRAAKYGNVAMIEALLREQASLVHSYKDDEGDQENRALHLAARFRHGSERLRCVKTLVEHGSDVNAVNYYGRTPLHMACMAKDSTPETQAIVAYLVEAGADVFARTRKGETPFHLAAAKGQTESAIFLLEEASQTVGGSRGEPFGGDGSGYTGLQTAVRMGHAELVERLVERGANINVRDEAGDTLLHLAIEGAVRKGHGSVPGYLRMMGCILLWLDVSVEEAGGGPELEKLSNGGHMRILRYFHYLDGYDDWVTNDYGLSPFHLVNKKAWVCLKEPAMFDTWYEETAW